MSDATEIAKNIIFLKMNAIFVYLKYRSPHLVLQLHFSWRVNKNRRFRPSPKHTNHSNRPQITTCCSLNNVGATLELRPPHQRQSNKKKLKLQSIISPEITAARHHMKWPRSCWSLKNSHPSHHWRFEPFIFYQRSDATAAKLSFFYSFPFSAIRWIISPINFMILFSRWRSTIHKISLLG